MKFRSRLTGETCRVKRRDGDIVTILLSSGNTACVHRRDFDAEYRAVTANTGAR